MFEQKIQIQHPKSKLDLEISKETQEKFSQKSVLNY